MSFMQPETYHGHFQLVRNTSDGDILTPEEYAEHRGNDDAAEAYGVTPEDVETVFGWSARLSAPGYLDCTDWIGVFDTEDEALAALQEMYPDDDESESDDE